MPIVRVSKVEEEKQTSKLEEVQLLDLTYENYSEVADITLE